MTRHFTDPNELAEKVGLALGTSAPVRISQHEINSFADLTGDHQWIHTDPERAAVGPFGATIVHGYFLLALIPKFAADIFTVDNLSMSVNYGLEKVRFPVPLRPDISVSATATLTAAKQTPQGWRNIITFAITSTESLKPHCVADCVVLFA